jgi:hypothetical protein
VPLGAYWFGIQCVSGRKGGMSAYVVLVRQSQGANAMAKR